MIIERMQADKMQAMKDKNEPAKDILGFVIAKVKDISIAKGDREKPLADVEVVAVLQKTIKELNETSDNYAKANNKVMQQTIEAQKALLEKYMPKMLSEKEIADIIAKQADKSIPNIMKLFKAEYAGKCDMQLVQKVLKTFA